jgi:hypothetical protein
VVVGVVWVLVIVLVVASVVVLVVASAALVVAVGVPEGRVTIALDTISCDDISAVESSSVQVT